MGSGRKHRVPKANVLYMMSGLDLFIRIKWLFTYVHVTRSAQLKPPMVHHTRDTNVALDPCCDSC